MRPKLSTLDEELGKRLKNIERIEMELFLERIRLAGLKSTKDILLRKLTVTDKKMDEITGDDYCGD